MQVLCLSLITNSVLTPNSSGPAATHLEVLDAVNERSVQMRALVSKTVELSASYLGSLPDLKEILVDDRELLDDEKETSKDVQESDDDDNDDAAIHLRGLAGRATAVLGWALAAYLATELYKRKRK